MNDNLTADIIMIVAFVIMTVVALYLLKQVKALDRENEELLDDQLKDVVHLTAHHLQIEAMSDALGQSTNLLNLAEAAINQLDGEVTSAQAEIVTLSARIVELLAHSQELHDEITLLEERTHSTIDDQMKGQVAKIAELQLAHDEHNSEIIKLNDALIKADRQNVSIQRVVSEQENLLAVQAQAMANQRTQLIAVEQELAENRHAADSDVMAIADAVSEDSISKQF